jgi:sortase A
MLLKVGIVMMTVALAFAAVTAGIAVVLRDKPVSAIAAKPAANSRVEPLIRSYTLEDRAGEAQERPLPQSEPPEPKAEPPKEEQPKAEPEQDPQPKPAPELPPKSQAQAEPRPQSKSEPKPEPNPQTNSEPEREVLPVAKDDWPAPTEEELQAVNRPRHYDLPRSAIMGLTIKAMELYNVPVINSDSQWAFSSGVVHEPETSLPWSNTPQRNVYLAAHRLGYYGTSSRLVFFNLDKLREGDRLVLEDRSGKAYEYRVSEVFVVDPTDVWVMGRVRGRDMVTLQTCTPVPTFEKRLIVRADRV